jgi:hypothetical protein
VPLPSSKTSQLRLDPFTILLDENHSRNPHILKMLSQELNPAEKVTGIGLAPEFPNGMRDEDWLPVVGSQRVDRHIR